MYKTVSEISSIKKLCAKWVPKLLMDNHKKCTGTALMFLDYYQQESKEDEFLDHIFTGDETWIAHITPENKQHSLTVAAYKFSKTENNAQKIIAMSF